MKIIALNGSRRKKGNTRILLETILKPAATAGIETEQIFLGDYRIEACTGCEGCSKSWDCVIKDDFAEIIAKLDHADGIVFGSPTYWYTVTSDMKRFLDRCYSLIQFPKTRQQWIGKYQNSGKVCVTAAVCEQHEEAMMGTTLTLLSDFSRDIGLELLDSVAALRCFEAGSIKQESAVLQQAELAGNKLARQKS
ncbi:NADPH-dependent FMN reductase [Malonomonas rubra DSM 5091]|uniref:NADPH-dependent FMN reductase n=1 Tax=Malonomonas rubra DSM 5091 TaxID=1122189 RepID=A0A1M6ITU0_MALRU|nr:flavodoxin family protein [Malonomonas rubra]SHJ37866.1 NADPH-dependent FMN reductase [Malonomonas rubra DSM 5091]